MNPAQVSVLVCTWSLLLEQCCLLWEAWLNMKFHFQWPSFCQIISKPASEVAQGFTAWPQQVAAVRSSLRTLFPELLYKSQQPRSKFPNRLWNQEQTSGKNSNYGLSSFHFYRMKIWNEVGLIGELPDVIMYITGENTLYARFLVYTVRGKEKSGKNDKSLYLDTSQLWRKQNTGERFGKLMEDSSEMLGSNRVIVITQAVIIHVISKTGRTLIWKIEL